MSLYILFRKALLSVLRVLYYLTCLAGYIKSDGICGVEHFVTCITFRTKVFFEKYF